MSQEELAYLKKRHPVLFSIFAIIKEQGPISTKEISAKRYGEGSERFNKYAQRRTIRNVRRLIDRGAPVVRRSPNGALGVYEVVS